jgi:hypothetical protein
VVIGGHVKVQVLSALIFGGKIVPMVMTTFAVRRYSVRGIGFGDK